MLYYGFTKLSATPEVMEMIGGAAHKVGLTFLSTTIRFWVATVTELVAGVMLVLGLWSRLAAALVLLIIVFAINGAGLMRNSLAVAIVALIVLVKGGGARAVSSHCCDDGDDDGCCGGHCHPEMTPPASAPKKTVKMNEMA